MDVSSRERYEIRRDIYNAYVLYCRDNRITPLSDNSFGMELAQRRIKKERNAKKRVNNSITGVIGSVMDIIQQVTQFKVIIQCYSTLFYNYLHTDYKTFGRLSHRIFLSICK